MKIKRVLPNNRKKAFIVESKKGIHEFPYALLRLKPSTKNPISSVYVDPELANEGFTYVLLNGKEDSVLLEQVLYINRDPDVTREYLLYDLSCTAQKLLKDSKITKRSLARRLEIQPTQLYRLLDQTFYGKTIDQMVRLLTALGSRVEISTKLAA